MIFSTFKNSVVPYDGNLTNYTKETKELLKRYKVAMGKQKIADLKQELAELDEESERYMEVLAEISDLQNALK